MMPLTMSTPGVDVKLVAIHGGRTVRQPLADLGLTPGAILRVVQADAWGPPIVAFKDDARLALGRGMAHKIKVEPLAS
ncbi:MAG: FeoA family protein [Chloroflexota bacterium]|nr:FeoA family protein [Chloroflexota bacterium]